jgi:uncharacterized membrane protein HdeD (DUF308 family)
MLGRTFSSGLSWGWIVARGVAAMVLGFLVLAWPRATWLTLVMLFAVFAFAEGVANIISAIRGGKLGEPRWGTLLLEGLLSVAVAILAVVWPARMTIAFVWMLGIWGIVNGALRIGTAVRLRKIIQHEWALGLSGALSIAFGAVLLFQPVVGTLALIWWLGSYAIIFGALIIGVGFRVRRSERDLLRERMPPAGGLPQRAR